MIVHLTMINIYQQVIEQILKQQWPKLKMKEEDFYVSNSPLLINATL